MTPKQIADMAVTQRGAMQKPKELASFFQFLKSYDIKNIVEIGGMYGGTLWAWDQIRSPGGKLVCVDLLVLEGRLEHALDLDCVLIEGDSSNPTVRLAVDLELEGEQADLLFIDGDHKYDGVKADWDNFESIVSEFGIVAFHDVCHRPMPGYDMWRFWEETRNENSFVIYDPKEPWGGIGVMVNDKITKLPPYATKMKESPHPNRRCDGCSENLLLNEDILCGKCAQLSTEAYYA